MPARPLLILLASVVITGCSGSGDPELDPAQRAQRTVQQMSALAQKGDWAAYVDGYYGEAHKFREDADRQELIARFEDGWGDVVRPALERAANLTPVIEGDGAIFRDGEEVVFELHRDDAGGWGFHL